MEKINKKEYIDKMIELVKKARLDIDSLYNNISDNIYEAFFDVEMLKTACDIYNKTVAQMSSAKNMSEKDILFFIDDNNLPIYIPINEFVNDYSIDIGISKSGNNGDGDSFYQ